jgi:hypothetical protein
MLTTTASDSTILGQVLGDRQPQMQQALSAQTGLDAGSIGGLLALLAPVVMGMIGKKSNASPGGGFSLDDLGSILGREKADAQSRNPDIGAILDSFTGGSGGVKGRSRGGIMDSIGDRFGKKNR